MANLRLFFSIGSELMTKHIIDTYTHKSYPNSSQEIILHSARQIQM